MRWKNAQDRKLAGSITVFVGLLVGFFGFMAVAQTPAAGEQPAAALIGAPVFSAEGTEVGTVAAVTVAKDGQVSQIHLTTSSPRGLGERTVAVRQGSFTVLEGAVVLDLSAEEVDALPVQTAVHRGTSA